mgnify:CR=1 FL=1
MKRRRLAVIACAIAALLAGCAALLWPPRPASDEPTWAALLAPYSQGAPVADGSIVDFVAHLSREVTPDEVNARFAEVADTGRLAGILRYTDEPIVSTDIIGSPYSSIFDSGLTMAHGNEVKVFSWYDNEWGYSCRLVDLVQRLL